VPEIIMNNLKLALIPGCEKLFGIVDATSGEIVHFQPVQVPGKGWTVAKMTSGKHTGRTIERAEGFEGIESYSMDQALIAVEHLTRETIRALMPAL
jgi:hypothetical protein